VLGTRGACFDQTQYRALIPGLLLQRSCDGVGFQEFRRELGFALGVLFRGGDRVRESTLTRVLDRLDCFTQSLLCRLAALLCRLAALLCRLAALLRVRQSPSQLFEVTIRGSL
jgi:hypothetical protein